MALAGLFFLVVFTLRTLLSLLSAGRDTDKALSQTPLNRDELILFKLSGLAENSTASGEKERVVGNCERREESALRVNGRFGYKRYIFVETCNDTHHEDRFPFKFYGRN